MELTKDEIKEFQKIYFEVFGEKISIEEAEMKAKSLLEFAAIAIDENYEELFGEVPKEKLNNFRFEPPKKPTGE